MEQGQPVAQGLGFQVARRGQPAIHVGHRQGAELAVPEGGHEGVRPAGLGARWRPRAPAGSIDPEGALIARQGARLHGPLPRHDPGLGPVAHGNGPVSPVIAGNQASICGSLARTLVGT